MNLVVRAVFREELHPDAENFEFFTVFRCTVDRQKSHLIDIQVGRAVPGVGALVRQEVVELLQGPCRQIWAHFRKISGLQLPQML